MHDILEGICRIEMFNIIKHCLKDAKYFSLKTLNHRLTFFRLKNSENRPPLISANDILNERLKTTVSQMLAFVLNFGLIVGDLITNKDDKFWQLYKLLREILCVSMQTSIDASTPMRFESLVKTHHLLYIELLGNLIPNHFLTHYADIMRTFGPVINTWCMRYEDYHLILKKYCSATRNRINLCYSIALRNQLILSDYFLRRNPFAEWLITFSKYKSCVSSEEFQYSGEKYIKVRNVTIDRTKFGADSIASVKINEQIPLFVKIYAMYKKKAENGALKNIDTVFDGQIIKAVEFDKHYQAYAVENMDTHALFTFDSLCSYKLYNCIEKCDNKCFIVHSDFEDLFSIQNNKE